MKIVIDGAGEVGSHLAKMLSREANEIAVIDNDSQRLAHLIAIADVEPIEGDPASIATLREAGADKADLFVAVYPQAGQDVNVVSALLAKKLGAAKVVARVGDPEYLQPENQAILESLGIDLVFCPESTAAHEIADQLKHTATADTTEFAGGQLQIAVFRLEEDATLLDTKLIDFIGQIPAEDASRFRIIAVSRGNQTLIPHPNTVFRFGDLVYTISRADCLEMLSGFMGVCDTRIDNVIIVGGGSIAEQVADFSSRQVGSVKLIERSRERCVELSEHLSDRVMVVCGDGRDSDFLYDEGIRDCDAFVALTGSDESNIFACVMARKLGVPRTFAEVENLEYVRLAEEMGVDTVINKKLITASRIYKYTLSGTARFVRNMTGTDAEVMEYTVKAGSAITKGPLKDIEFPENAVVGGVIRGAEAFIAVGDTHIQEGDHVAVFALPESIRAIDKLFR